MPWQHVKELRSSLPPASTASGDAAWAAEPPAATLAVSVSPASAPYTCAEPLSTVMYLRPFFSQAIETERQTLVRLLGECGGNVSKARTLGVSRGLVYRHLKADGD